MACKIDKIAILSDLLTEPDSKSNEILVNKSEYLSKDWQVVTLCSGKLIAIAKDRKLTIWKQSNGNNTNDLIDLKIVHQQQFADQITKLVGCPLFLQSASYNANPDIYCFFLGFTSGHVKILNDKGQELFDQQFDKSEVIQIKVRTCYSKSLACKYYNYADHKHEDHLAILYQDDLVTFSLQNLFKVLKLALIQSNIGARSSSKPTATQIPYKKWTVPSQIKTINDFVFVPNYSTSSFDQFVRLSHENNQSLRSKVTSHSSDYALFVGQNAFLVMAEASTQRSLPTLTNIAGTAFGAIKEAIPFFGSSEEVETLETCCQMNYRFQIVDPQREAQSIVINSDSSLALISDELGRVCLFDLTSLTLIRMWKGYRNCEFAFIEVRENEKLNEKCKQSTFVCLHMPRRQTLEVWPAKYGSRVCAFKVGKRCRLISNEQHALGLSYSSLKNLLEIKDANEFLFNSTAYLFDFDLQTLFQVTVPFVCSVQNQENSKMKDTLILKQLPLILDRKDFAFDRIFDLFTGLQINANKLQFLNVLIKQNQIELFKRCVCDLREELEKLTFLDEKNALVLQKCIRYQQLIRIYDLILKHNAGYERIRLSRNIIEEAPEDVDIEASELNLEPIEFTRIISLLSYGESLNSSVHSLFVPNLDCCTFINSFHIETKNAEKNAESEYKVDQLLIRSKSDAAVRLNLGNFLFVKQLAKGYDLTLIQSYLENGFDPFDLLRVLFTAWVSEYYAINWKTWHNLNKIAITIIDHINRSNKDVSHEVQLFSQQITNLILDSDHLSSAIVATSIFEKLRLQFVEVKSESEVNEQSTESDTIDLSDDQSKDELSEEEWENLSIEKEDYNWSLKQLKDAYVLNLLLHLKEAEPSRDVTLNYLRKQHSSIVSELVAKWCIDHEIIPEFKIDSELESDDQSKVKDRYLLNLGDESIPFAYNAEESEQVKQLLYHLRIRFPFSLEPDVLLANCAFYSVQRFFSNCSNNLSIYQQHCVNYLNRISSIHLKHALACLMWNRLFVNKFKLFFQSIDKNEFDQFKLSQANDLVLMVTNGIHFACELMELILNTIYHDEPAPEYKSDEWWKDDDQDPTDESKQSIFQLALMQPKAKAEIVLEHCHLLFVISLAHNFSLDYKNKLKPLQLFPLYVQQSLFRELNIDLEEYMVEDSVIEARKRFAIESIRAIAKTVPVVSVGIPNDMERKSYAMATSWMSRLLTVCREWSLEIDVVRRRFISCLYEMDSCVFAEELLNTVSNPEDMAKELVEIAAIRVINLIGHLFFTEINRLPSNTAFWLRSLKQKKASKIKEVPSADFNEFLKTTRNLLQNIIDRLPQDSPYLKQTIALFDYLKTVKEKPISKR